MFTFQQTGAAALLDGENPHEDRYPNLYEGHPDFYGPGVVDANQHLTVGLPHPPFSLLLALPAYLLGGDSRYADVAAIAGSAAPDVSVGIQPVDGPDGRAVSVDASRAVPRSRYAWTETIFAFTFSVMMFCAV